MPLSPEDVRALVAAFDGSDWDEMTLTVDGTRLALSRRGLSPTAPGAPAESPAPTPTAAPLPRAVGPPAAPPAAASPAAPPVGGGAVAGAPNAATSASPGRAHAASAAAAGTAPATAAAGATPVGAPGAPSASAEPAGQRVTAPSVGLFWRSPKPGAPPFVEVGDEVGPDDTVCIVEVMKLMNHVRAGVAGTVRAVHPENGEMVEHGDPLFTIEPAR